MDGRDAAGSSTSARRVVRRQVRPTQHLQPRGASPVNDSQGTLRNKCASYFRWLGRNLAFPATCPLTPQDSGDLSVDDFVNAQSTPVIRTADVQRGLDLFAPWLHNDNKQPFLLVGPEGCGKGSVFSCISYPCVLFGFARAKFGNARNPLPSANKRQLSTHSHGNAHTHSHTNTHGHGDTHTHTHIHTHTPQLQGLYPCCQVTPVSLQAVAATQLQQPALDAGGDGSLQRTDGAVARAAETGPDVHGDQHQHGPRLPTQGLRAPRALPQGPQPPEARQVGHVATHRLLAAGRF